MTPLQMGFASIAIMLVMIGFRIPIGVALGLVSFVGLGFLRGFDTSLGLLRTIPHEFAASWELSAIPMFLLMGSVAHNSGISTALFHAARLWLAGLPGGLVLAANFACAGFAAASGSSVATAAAMGRIAIPEMLRLGYDKSLATGVVACAGTLGSLIPPSILFVIYGIFAEVSISKLLIAGVIPGLLTATIYGVIIIGRCALNPKMAPLHKIDVSWGQRFASLREIWPLLLLIIAIIGGLYSGLVTPTEAGAFGALVAFIVAVLQRKMNFQVFKESVLEALSASAKIFFVAIGAVLLTKFLALTGMADFMGDAIGEYALDPITLVIGASVIYVILGMFLDPLGIILLTLPILLPMFENIGLDLIWFGVLVVKYIEIGLVTPPVGLNVYVIKSVVGEEVDLETIFKGVTWFVLADLIVVALLVIWPDIALYLPSLMEE